MMTGMMMMITGQQPTKQTKNTQTRKETNKQASNHNSRTPRNPPGSWLKAPLCGNCVEIIIPTHHEIPRQLVESSAVWKTVWKVEFQNTTKSPRELVEAPLCGKRCGNHISKTPQHPTGNWLKAPLRWNTMEITIPKHHKIPQGIGWKLRCVGNYLEITTPKHHNIPQEIGWKLRCVETVWKS